MFEIELPFGFGSEEEFIFEMRRILPEHQIDNIYDALEVYGRMRIGII